MVVRNCGECEYSKRDRSGYPCNVCAGDPETYFGERKQPGIKCCVHGCRNVSGQVRGHTIRVESEIGEVREGYICNPCWTFLRSGQGLYSTLAKNGRLRRKEKDGKAA